MIDVFFTVLDDLNVVLLAILIMLFKLASNYSIWHQIFINNNNNNIINAYQNDYHRYHQEFVHQVGESAIIDNGSRIIKSRFGDSSQPLIMSNDTTYQATYQATNDGTRFANASDLNDNYSHFVDDLLHYHSLVYDEPFIVIERDMIAIRELILTDSTKKEETFTSSLILVKPPGIAVKMKKEYNTVQSHYLHNTVSANLHYNTTNDDFTQTMNDSVNDVLFEDYRIASCCCEARIEYFNNTDVIFPSYGNESEYFSGNETRSTYFVEFDTLLRGSGHVLLFL